MNRLNIIICYNIIDWFRRSIYKFIEIELNFSIFHFQHFWIRLIFLFNMFLMWICRDFRLKGKKISKRFCPNSYTCVNSLLHWLSFEQVDSFTVTEIFQVLESCYHLFICTGGHFVCKLFDVFTPFSAGLIYLMYRSFKDVSIHKPNTSRPANSER